MAVESSILMQSIHEKTQENNLRGGSRGRKVSKHKRRGIVFKKRKERFV